MAIKVTDEEYARILSVKKQVEEIKAKEELVLQEELSRASKKKISKWVPVFEKPKSEWGTSSEDEHAEKGKSKIASVLRVVAWIVGIIAVISGVVTALGTDNFLSIFTTIFVGVVEVLLFYALAAVLDYLAELTSIARKGYKYTESNK